MAHDFLKPLAEHLAQALAFHRIGQPRVERIDIGGELALAPQVVPGVLVGREHVLRIERQAARHAAQKLVRLRIGDLVILALIGKQFGVRPDRLAVLAPVQVQRPARQLLAGVPLALAVVQQATLPVLQAQLVHQVGAQQPLGRAHGLGVPFGAVAVVDRHEGRLAALREAHVVAAQVVIDPMTQCFDAVPLGIGVGQGDARRFPDPGHAHAVLELGLALVDRTADRRRRRWVGRTGQWDVALTGEQARGRVEPDPAGARQEHFAPGVQVGEIDLGAARAVERFHVALQLDQVARDEARRHAQVSHQLHQQPAGVAAGAQLVDQRFFGRLHARFHAYRVADVLLQLLVHVDQKVVHRRLLAGKTLAARVEVGLEMWRGLGLRHVRRQFGLNLRGVLERIVLGRRLQKKVERVEHRHLGHQIDLDAERGGLVRKHQTRQVVRLRVLLPVDEVGGRFDPHRVAQDAGARMRRRTQTHDLWTQVDGPVVAVVRHMVQRDVDGHSGLQGGHEQEVPEKRVNKMKESRCLPRRRRNLRTEPAPGSRD